MSRQTWPTHAEKGGLRLAGVVGYQILKRPDNAEGKERVIFGVAYNVP